MQRLLILFPIEWRGAPVASGEMVEVTEEDEAAAEWAVRVGAARLLPSDVEDFAAGKLERTEAGRNVSVSASSVDEPPSAGIMEPASAAVGRRKRPG
jgi:hypothetical protein